MANPFAHHDQLHTTDIVLARKIVTRALYPHELSVTDTHGRLDVWLWSQRLRNISVHDLAYGQDVSVIPGRLNSCYVVMIPVRGSSVVHCGAESMHSAPGAAAVPTPGESLRMRLSADCAQRLVRIDKPALDAHLRDMVGESLDRPLRFTLAMDTDTGHGRAFVEDVGLVARRLELDPSVYDSPQVVDSTESGLMTRLLLAAEHNYRDLLAREQPIAGTRIVRSTIEFMHAHPDWAHTIGSLAREQQVSTRTLERTFKRETGSSPMAYLKGVRLDRARELLLAARPDTHTVGGIARTMGFSNRTRFAADYQRRHGELPSETLRR